VDGLPSFDFVSFLSPEERIFSSSHRELLAFLRTLQHKGELLSSKGPVTLWWLTDNSNVSKFLSKGSGKLPIMYLVLEVLRLARSLFLDVRPIWVSRDHPWLQRADGLSKQIDTDNWSVWDGDFAFIARSFGPFTVDLFASAENAKVERFFSYSFENGCSGVDAFSFEWTGELAYIAPPVSLVTRVIKKISITRMTGVLLIPLWKSAKFWTFAFPDGGHLAEVFSELRVLSVRTSNWDTSTRDVLGNRSVSFLALRISSSGCGSLESKMGSGRCFRLLFGRVCKCMNN
jgi:hypothetical protein